jgi:hydroxymethylpyrimidine pyrophosphatase-like HAD family hydrolase
MVRQKLLALATDGDGTLLRGGHMGRDTIAALKRWRDAGHKLVLVTGENVRQIGDFPHADLFDRIVAENGALVVRSRKGNARRLCRLPSARLLRAFKEGHVWPMKRGRVILQAKFDQENNIRRILRRTKLPWNIIRNRKELIVIPEGITKATGVAAALKELGLSPRQAVAVGDAENDRAMLELCGLAVAVNNAVPKLKQKADLVTRGQYGKGVAELIDRLLANGNACQGRQRKKASN